MARVRGGRRGGGGHSERGWLANPIYILLHWRAGVTAHVATVSADMVGCHAERGWPNCQSSEERPGQRSIGSGLGQWSMKSHFRLENIYLGLTAGDEPAWQATPPGRVARGTRPPSAAMRPRPCKLRCSPPHIFRVRNGRAAPLGLLRNVRQNHSGAPPRETIPKPTAAANLFTQPRGGCQAAHVRHAL